MSEAGLDRALAEALAEQVAGRLALVRSRIEAAGGDPEKVRVVAVTKSFGPEAALAAVLAGLIDLGENYAGELVSKAALLAAGGVEARWHFIGAIQRNKVAALSQVVSCWQSLARPVEADAIAARAGGRCPLVLVQVNLSGAPRRAGCAPGEVAGLVAHARAAGLEVAGLMAVAPRGGPEMAASAFGEVARLRAELGLAQLSIGMSGDLEAAVRAGSTMVRVGSALFGPRDPHAAR